MATETTEQGILLKSSTTTDGTKELHQMDEETWRVTVFTEGPNGTDWDWEEFCELDAAEFIFGRIVCFDDLSAIAG